MPSMKRYLEVCQEWFSDQKKKIPLIWLMKPMHGLNHGGVLQVAGGTAVAFMSAKRDSTKPIKSCLLLLTRELTRATAKMQGSS